ncbi:MAG: M36 family metallopeptidase, partial [Actinomycetota bacterium]|nr:M36 family metallopeptidase [Actinomycetota bacterium]
FKLGAADVEGLQVLRDSPLYDSPDLRRVYREGKPAKNPDVAHVVLFRQTFGDLHAGLDGLLTVGVQRDGRVAWVSSSATGDDTVSGAQRLDAAAAIQTAAADVDLELGALTEVATPEDDWTTFESELAADVQRARLVALPTPRDGLRLAWEVTLLNTELDEHANPTAFITFVDAETGTVWNRRNQVDHFADGLRPALTAQTNEPPDDEDGDFLPTWRVFPGNPPFPYSDNPSEDTRVLWCWDSSRNPEECREQQRNTASRVPWDVQVSSGPTFTTDGNNASTAISEASPFTPDTAFDRPFSTGRSYTFAWNNSWFESKCNPDRFSSTAASRNDEAAATTNLFVMHNRMHDWSYYLGFTEVNSNLQVDNFGNTDSDRENDPEVGQSQAGRLTVLGRDNANQITLQDGIAPITNQYLWEPLAGAFYSPCVDGAYDMAVVAHEYTHAITNRMIAGPDVGTGDSQGQTESWSDLGFAEYFRSFNIDSVKGVDPFVLGPYVTGDTTSAIRNYAMNNSPLNYSDLEYDGNGLTSPHANGEIWSAVNFDISINLNKKYDDEFPSKDPDLQEACARGQLSADACPGNRRWAQLMFDGFLLQPDDSTMIDSRDGMLAADRLRFDGANQRELWDSFARRGLGRSAFSKPIAQGSLINPAERDDFDPLPGWDSPLRSDEARVTFTAGDTGAENMQVFVGDYEARVTPTADTDPETKDIDEVVKFVPGTYQFLARADGFGMHRFRLKLRPDENVRVNVPLRRNHASAASGAKITGDGVNLDRLIDDTEATNWASLADDADQSPSEEGRQVEGRTVTVELNRAHMVRNVQVSAVLNAGCNDDILSGNCDDEEDDVGTQSRFSALRSFDIFTCDASSGADCGSDEAAYQKVFASADDAFPGKRPRPKVPDFLLRPFDVKDTMATHVRLVVRDNQCTGGPDFQGDVNPVNDPVFSLPDCDSRGTSVGRQLRNTRGQPLLDPPENIVRAAELQVFSEDPRNLNRICADAPKATDYRDRDEVRQVHVRNVDCVIFTKIATGTRRGGEKFYEPRADVTRGQMASFIVNALVAAGHDDRLRSGGGAPEFSDIRNDTHRRNINRLARSGIVNGTGDGRFSPKATVSREQMATFLVQAAERVGNELNADGDHFADVRKDNVHFDNINAGFEEGLFSGLEQPTEAPRSGRFAPGTNVRRDQMASFLVNLYERFVGR